MRSCSSTSYGAASAPRRAGARGRPAVLRIGAGVAVSPLGIPFLLSIALGLGAFAAVERGTLAGDAGAMLLLVLAILSHTFGTIVAIGVAVYYVLERGRRRELWVPLVPLALWVAWWIWARQFDQGITEGSNIAGTPLFVVEAAGATLRGILGFAPDWPLAGVVWVLFDVAAAAGAVLLIVRAVARGATPWLWAYAVTLLAFWTGLGLSEGAERGLRRRATWSSARSWSSSSPPRRSGGPTSPSGSGARSSSPAPSACSGTW